MEGMASKMNKLINIKQASEFLNVCVTKIYNLVENNQIPHIRFGRAIRFSKPELLKWLDKNRIDVKRGG